MTATSFLGIFERRDGDVPAVEQIRIPLFQRDYAQGRIESDVSAIRHRFLTTLCDALSDGQPSVPLDFVYGEVTDGKLVPLDGQQRLTTLFLLHWYVAFRAGKLRADAPWTRFSYETRPGAELFTRMLVQHFADLETHSVTAQPSEWIADQDWFLYTWRFDPTVSGMLVVIDDIAAKLRDHPDFAAAWERLEEAAIWFHLLPIGDMGDETDLYIKMNSRGKPLTPFENFKAFIEEAIRSEDQRREFALRIDRDWSDTFWRLRKPDESRDAMDERFLRYFDFALDIGAWRRGIDDTENLRELSGAAKFDQRITEVLRRPDDDGHIESVTWLTTAFDAWTDRSPADVCNAYFARAEDRHPNVDTRLPLFFQSIDLFAACCNGYGESRFTLAQTLMLFATILSVSSQSDAQEADSSWRLRAVRNLVQATRLERTDMHRLVPAVEALILRGEFLPESGFVRAQVEQEQLKRRILSNVEPSDELLAVAIHRLEDHELFQGAIGAFELDTNADVFRRRAGRFDELFSESSDWSPATRALLTFGDYGWQRSKWHRQYGTTGDDRRTTVWRALFTERQDALGGTRSCLMQLLDKLEEATLDDILGAWLDRRERDRFFDWIYYFIKYPAMGEYTSGVFHLDDAQHRFLARRLRPGQTHQASKQDDPYLWAARALLDTNLKKLAKQPSQVWWMPCWMWVKDVDDAGFRSSAEGFVLKLPPDAASKFERMFADEPAVANDMVTVESGELDDHLNPTYVIRIAQADTEIGRVDLADRVQVAAALTRCMIGSTRRDVASPDVRNP